MFLQAPPEPEHLELSSIALDYAGFLAAFALYGALGFRLQVLRGADGAATGPDAPAMNDALHSAESTAARIGAFGAGLLLVVQMLGVAASATEKGIGFGAALHAAPGRTLAGYLFLALLVVLYAVAMRRAKGAWIAAAVVATLYTLRNAVTLRWFSVVNPLHIAAASLWLGTLMVLVVAGIAAVLRSTLPGLRRGELVAYLVNRFSPLALSAAGLLAVTGVVTAVRHLKYVAALWTTSYGITFLVKLALVGVVLGLGAWNWRRVRPRLGSERSALDIRRSSMAELTVAAIVLAVTALLVNLPAPKLPGT